MLCHCNNCEFVGFIDELETPLDQIPDLAERVAPGEPTPAGECPDCKALVHANGPEELPDELPEGNWAVHFQHPASTWGIVIRAETLGEAYRLADDFSPDDAVTMGDYELVIDTTGHQGFSDDDVVTITNEDTGAVIYRRPE